MFLVSNTQTTTLHKVRAHTYIDCNEKADALIKLEHVQKAGGSWGGGTLLQVLTGPPSLVVSLKSFVIIKALAT